MMKNHRHILLFFLVLSAAEPQYAAAADSSLVELERGIQADGVWISEADRLLDELHAMDVRLYTLINRVGSEESRRKLLSKRSDIRRLIIELTEERNVVYTDLVRKRRDYDLRALSPELYREG